MEVVAGGAEDEDPEIEVDDEESSQLDVSNAPVIITLTKVSYHLDSNPFLQFLWRNSNF